MNKDAIYKSVIDKVQGDKKLKPMTPSGRCFYYALHTVDALRKNGLRAILQAGSCQWPRIRPEQDDGVCATHFGYVWSPQEAPSQMAVALDRMPEMHVWAAIPEGPEIIDFTSGFFPEQAKIIGGFDWPGDPPPKYIWGTPDTLPEGVHYKPDMAAIKFVLIAAARVYGLKFVKERIL